MLMKRLGFVRLDRYGLVLTPEGRIMSLRPAILDGGGGCPIVGWTDDDLADVELAKWPPSPAPSKAVASPVAISMDDSGPRFTVPMPSPVVQIMTIPVPPPPPVATAPQVEEDDWEWEIALARARAAAEESESATRAAPILQPTLPTVATKHEPIQAKIESWPKTEPLGNIDYEDYSSSTRDVIRVARGTEPPPISKVVRVPTPPPVVKQPLAPVVVKPASPPSRKVPTIPMRPLAKPVGKPVTVAHAPAAIATAPTEPTTIIPVPRLGRVDNAQTLAPVRSSTVTPIASAPRRIAKGTGMHEPKAVVATLEPRPPIVAPNPPAGRSKLPSILQRSR